MKRRKNLVWLVALVGVILVVAAAGQFFFSEWRREQLLRQYAPDSALLEAVRKVGVHDLSTILRGSETVVCSLGGYGRVDDLAGLNSSQKESAPKSNLPSEDATWYLLFFSSDRLNRVAVFSNYGERGVLPEGDRCVSGDSRFVVKPGDEPTMRTFSLQR